MNAGAIVRDRLSGRWGEVVRGRRRASRGMVWVQWEGAEHAVQWHSSMLVYWAQRGPIDRVKAALAQLTGATIVTARDPRRIIRDRNYQRHIKPT